MTPSKTPRKTPPKIMSATSSPFAKSPFAKSPFVTLRTGSRVASSPRFLATLALLTAIGSVAAHAEGTPEQRRACRADAMRLCREFVPNVKRITACMEANKAQLSPLCRTQFK